MWKKKSKIPSKIKGRSIVIVIQVVCFASAAALMGRPVASMVKRAYLEWHAERIWSARKGIDTPQAGTPIAWLRAEPARLDTLILYGATPDNLSKFPCLSARGVLPENEGTRIIQGHRDVHFKELGGFDIGDEAHLETRGGSIQTYRVVEREILTKEQLERRFRYPRPFDGLVLITCYPFRYTGPAPQRYLVWLKRIPDREDEKPAERLSESASCDASPCLFWLSAPFGPS